jgi:hypothetical protein
MQLLKCCWASRQAGNADLLAFVLLNRTYQSRDFLCRYNVPKELVTQVLSTYCLPVRVENPGNGPHSDFEDPFGVDKLSGVAGWPRWFKRGKA